MSAEPFETDEGAFYVRHLEGEREFGKRVTRQRYHSPRAAALFERWLGDRARGVDRVPDYLRPQIRIGSAAKFTYEEKIRRATYTGQAHLSGPQGDMTAERIELYLKSSGNELERAEAYDEKNAMTLREQSRTTTGSRMTYTAADDRYVVTGTPVKNVDECGRETTGRTLTIHRPTDSIVVDANGFRTQTKEGAGCL